MPPGEDHVDLAITNLCILAVPQPDTNGQVRLPGARRDIVHFQGAVDTLSSSPTTVTLFQSASTVEDILAQILHTLWVHFASHGIQDQLIPLDGGLALATGRRYKLSDTIQVSAHPRGGNRLAFLSACQDGDGKSGLVRVGGASRGGDIVGRVSGRDWATMWSIWDRDAPEVAQSTTVSFGPTRRRWRRRGKEDAGCERSRTGVAWGRCAPSCAECAIHVVGTIHPCRFANSGGWVLRRERRFAIGCKTDTLLCRPGHGPRCRIPSCVHTHIMEDISHRRQDLGLLHAK